MFPNGIPINSTFHIQNGNFSACGQIIATSLAQGGPAPSFLDESVYNIMVDPDVDVKKLDEKHLTENDLQLIQSIRENLSSHHETIIDHGYTGTIDEAHMDEIVNSVIIRASLHDPRLLFTPGCFLPRVESPQRVTLSQSNVYKRSHEKGSQAGSAPLAG